MKKQITHFRMRYTSKGIEREITTKAYSGNNEKGVCDQGIEEEREKILFTLYLSHQADSMGISKKLIDRFWMEFNTEGKDEIRHSAWYGLIEKNYSNEIRLIENALEFQKKYDSGKFKDAPDLAMRSLSGFALQFANIINDKDISALRRITEITKNNHKVPDGEKHGIGSGDRNMLEKFCDLHIASRSLPTKAELRKACGLNSLADKKLADNRMKKLGLWGLPTELEI